MIPSLTAALVALALGAAAPAALAQSSPQDKRAQSSQPQSGRQAQSASEPQKAAGLSKQDRQYFRDMAQANLAEVETGKLAQQQASSGEVKQYAERMVEDHGRMMQEQERMAGAKGLQMPTQPKKEHQAAVQKLKKAKGEQFDRAYMSQMVQDHEKTLKLVQQAAKNAKDAELKAMAQKAEPDIKEHLQLAKDLSDRASAGASKPGK
jgi:putative membrane protein